MRVPVNAGDAEAAWCRFSSQHGVDGLQETKEKTCRRDISNSSG